MGTHSHHKRAGAQTTHDEEDAGEEFWNTLNKFSKNPDRPRRNNYCIIGGFLAGLAGIVAFAVLASMAANSRNSCQCMSMVKALASGAEKLPDPAICNADSQYMQCVNLYGAQFKLYAGLAGGFAGLFVLSLLLFRYS